MIYYSSSSSSSSRRKAWLSDRLCSSLFFSLSLLSLIHASSRFFSSSGSRPTPFHLEIFISWSTSWWKNNRQPNVLHSYIIFPKQKSSKFWQENERIMVFPHNQSLQSVWSFRSQSIKIRNFLLQLGLTQTSLSIICPKQINALHFSTGSMIFTHIKRCLIYWTIGMIKQYDVWVDKYFWCIYMKNNIEIIMKNNMNKI
jgi:hypothetical protein